MAAKEMSTSVSNEILDEVWLMMHMAAEMGCSEVPSNKSSRKFIFEAEVEPEYLEDVVEADSPGHGEEKERAYIAVAEKLMQMGDDLQSQKKQKSEIQELSKEISDYIKEVMAPDIQQRLSSPLSRTTATNILSETGVLSLVYGIFKKKVEDFIGPGEDMGHIALVTSITKGVASGLKQSTSGVAGLLATVSTKFVEEKFGPMLQRKGSLTNLVAEEQGALPQ